MFTERLAGTSARHPWAVIIVWVFILVAAALSARAFLGAALTTQGSFTNHPQSVQAQNLIEQRLTGPAKDTELLIVRSGALTVSDPRFAAFVTSLRSSVLALGPAVVLSARPLVFLFVLGLSFVLLLLVFRSVVVPATAIAMNLLSVGAAYGMLVLVFQTGGPAIGRWIANAFGFQQVPAIEAWLPLFLFSVLFGLSMDYNVFLLSRIREHHLRTHDNTASVAFGLSHTGGIITGAALIMVAVFGGVALGNLAMMQQMGFGLAVAVLLDATVVRCLLVPGVMKLLGDANWYLPRWLSWLPNLSVGQHEEPPARPPAMPVPAGPRA
jgi:putative drug exporter of the RND superfamily